jgi:hypothetical protein
MIKITRAFIGPGNSLQIAQIPDSSYFPNISATITERLSSGSIGRTWDLYDTVVTTKDTDGIFYAPEQRVYAFRSGSSDNSDSPTNTTLLSDATYDLRILINEGGTDEFEVFGSTDIVSGISTTTDSPNNQFKFALNSVGTGEYGVSQIGVSNGDAAVLNTALVIEYREFIGSDTVNQSINWTLGEVETGSGISTNFSAEGETFYSLIASSCESGNPAVFKRQLVGITEKVVAGSVDLYNYILVNQPSTSIAQNKPTFTNLTATNEHPVLGLFSSRLTYTYYHPMSGVNQNTRSIDRNSTQELCVGPICGPFDFCSQQSLDVATNQPWACN